MDTVVPVCHNIRHLYPSEALHVQEKRFEDLVTSFSKIYGRSPQFIARSPGRVNLIGEHIDYSLYEVLPMAIVADVLVAVVPLSGSIKVFLNNVNVSKFPSGSFNVPEDGLVDIDPSTLEWTNYFKAGFNGAITLLNEKLPKLKPCGMQILVDGSVTAGGGLSSSAAFVCASTLAVLKAYGFETIQKKELVELAIVSERSVGVNSGGMDQAASVFSIRGDATSVSFFPELHVEAVPFPEIDPPVTFMIAQSFVAAEKHIAAPEQYNLRVVECTLAAHVLAKKMGVNIQGDSGPLGTSLRGCQHAYFANFKDSPTPNGEEQIKKMLLFTNDMLDKLEGYSREDIASILSLTVATLEGKFMTKFPIRAERFYLRQRAQHVFTEALRVQAFKRLLKSTPSENKKGLLPELGALLNESHASSRDVYVHSCPEIDELCEIANEAGSYGGRVTGAGWGGSAVFLVAKDKVDAVRAAWEKKYYRRRDPEISKEKLQEAVVVSEPGNGSAIYVLPNN